MAQNFAIKIPMTHIVSVLKVAEVVQGDFCCALERIDHQSAVCFLFTKVLNFEFNIGVAHVLFEEEK